MTVPNMFPDQKTPVVGVSAILGTGGSAGDSQLKILMIGVGLSTGSKSSGDIDPVASPDDADTYYGAGGSAARMVRRAIDEGTGALVYGAFMADAGGTAAQATITVTGTASAAGTYMVCINGWIVNVSIANGDAQNTIAAAIDTAIKASPYYDQMPVTSAVAANIVTLTTKEQNEEATELVTNIWQDTTTVYTANIALNTAATAGAGALDMTAILTAAQAYHFDYIVTRCSDSTNGGLLETHCDTMSSALKGKYCQGVMGSMDTHANIVTLATGLNAFRVQIVDAYKCQHAHFEGAAVWTAWRMFEEGSRPQTAYSDYPIPTIKVPKLVTDHITDTQIETALDNGITPIAVDGGGQAYIPRSVTSHCQTSGGAPDDTVLDTSNVTITHACAMDIKSDFATAWMVKPGVAFNIMDDPTDGSRIPSQYVTPLLVTRRCWGWLDRWHKQKRIVNPESPVDYKKQVSSSRSGNRTNTRLTLPCAGGAYQFDVQLYQKAA